MAQKGAPKCGALTSAKPGDISAQKTDGQLINCPPHFCQVGKFDKFDRISNNQQSESDLTADLTTRMDPPAHQTISFQLDIKKPLVNLEKGAEKGHLEPIQL